MDLRYIIDGIIIGFMASIPLGPIGVLCIQRTLSKSRWSGFVSGLGAATSDAIYAIIAIFSLSYVVSFIEKQVLILHVLGVVILVFLGLKIFYANPAVQLRRQRKRSNSFVQDYVSTFFLTITNPLYVFLFIGIFAGFRVVMPQNDILNQMTIIAGVFIGAAIWWFILTSVVSLFRSKINLRRLWWINKIAGGLIIGLVISAFVIWIIREYLC